MKYASRLSVSVLAISVGLAGTALAQSSHDQHHPGGDTRSAQATQMPMQQGTMPPQMPGTGQMGQGNMPGGMAGPGMMGQGMMGQGMMQGGMMQMMGSKCPAMGMMMGGGDMPAFIDGRIAFLKAELAVTDAQTSAWNSYASALKKNLQGMQGMRQTMMTALTGTSPTSRLDAHVSAMESRLAALKDVKPALANFYAALSAEQKTKADQILTGMGCMM